MLPPVCLSLDVVGDDPSSHRSQSMKSVPGQTMPVTFLRPTDFASSNCETLLIGQGAQFVVVVLLYGYVRFCPAASWVYRMEPLCSLRSLSEATGGPQRHVGVDALIHWAFVALHSAAVHRCLRETGCAPGTARASAER